MTNCKNCGAPLTKAGKCEYCGTEYAAPAQEGGLGALRVVMEGLRVGALTMNEARTVLYADDKPIEVIE